MTEDLLLPPSLIVTEWPRFSAYEFKETTFGEVIAPTKGSKLEWYAPLQEGLNATAFTELQHILGPTMRSEKHWVFTSRYAAALGPHGSLGSGGWMQERWAWPLRLTRHRRCELLEWCSQHGLLGVLLERLHSLCLPPRVVRDYVGVKGEHEVQEDFTFAAGAWRTRRRWDPPKWPSSDALLDLWGPLPFWRPSRAVLELPDPEDEMTEKPTTVPLDDPELLAFFPELGGPDAKSDALFYPKPGGESFWWAYAEPLGEMVAAVALLSNALRTVVMEPKDLGGDAIVKQRVASGENRRRVAKEEVAYRRGSARAHLNTLASRTSPCLVDSATGNALAWSYASLWGLLCTVMMAHVAKREVRLCAWCGQPFPARGGGKYCRPACNSAAAQKTHREKYPEHRFKSGVRQDRDSRLWKYWIRHGGPLIGDYRTKAEAEAARQAAIRA